MNTDTTIAIGVRIQGDRVVPVYDAARKHGGVTLFTTVANDQRKAQFDFYCRRYLSKSWQHMGSVSLFIGLPRGAGEPEFHVDVSLGRDGIVLARVRHGKQLMQKQFDVRRTEIRRLETEWQKEHGVREKARSICRAELNGMPRDEGGRREGRKRLLVRTLTISFSAICLTIFIALFFLRLDPWNVKYNWIERRNTGTVSSQTREQSTAPRKTEGQEAKSSDVPNEDESSSGEMVADSTVQKRAPTSAVEEREAHAEVAESPDTLEYRINWGDTLWRISKRYYGYAEMYPELAEQNSIENPNRITAGASLALPPVIQSMKRIGEYE